MVLPLQHKLSSSFHQLTKPTIFTQVLMTIPLFAQNVLGLTLVLCIVFIADFFPWLDVERIQSTEVRQFCLRPMVNGIRTGITTGHVADAAFYIMVIKLKCKTYFSDIPLKCWKFQTIFLRKCYEIVWKFQNKKWNNRWISFDLCSTL